MAIKYLTIIRHSKASSNYGEIDDIDRPLKERGISDSYSVAEKLTKIIKPDLIISSPAIRALHTAIVFARVLKYPSEKILIRKDMYLTGINTILKTIKEVNPSINSLMVFGHNPTVSDIANKFLNKSIEQLPTTGVIGFKLELDSWQEIEKSKVLESFYHYPVK